MNTIYVVQNRMLGWDSVTGVFQFVDKKTLEERFPNDEEYFIQEFEIQNNLDEFLAEKGGDQ